MLPTTLAADESSGGLGDGGTGGCELPASRDGTRPLSGDASHGDERAVHLIRNTLHGAIAYAALTRDLADAFAATQLRLDALFHSRIDPRPTELRALCDRAFKASLDALPDHAALKLGKRTADLKHELTCRGGGID